MWINREKSDQASHNLCKSCWNDCHFFNFESLQTVYKCIILMIWVDSVGRCWLQNNWYASKCMYVFTWSPWILHNCFSQGRLSILLFKVVSCLGIGSEMKIMHLHTTQTTKNILIRGTKYCLLCLALVWHWFKIQGWLKGTLGMHCNARSAEMENSPLLPHPHLHTQTMGSSESVCWNQSFGYRSRLAITDNWWTRNECSIVDF